MTTKSRTHGWLGQILENELETVKAYLKTFGTTPKSGWETTPWTVNRITVESSDLHVSVVDKNNNRKDFSVPREDLKLIQYVGDASAPSRTLYAEFRTVPKGATFGSSNNVVYLGQIDRNGFKEIEPELKSHGIDWVWYPIERKKTANTTIPEAQSP